jgi:hypothetical protein
MASFGHCLRQAKKIATGAQAGTTKKMNMPGKASRLGSQWVANVGK